MPKFDVEVEVKVMFEVEAETAAAASEVALQTWDQHTGEDETDTLFIDVYDEDGELVYNG